MDLRQLSALIAVAEGGSITAAARSLHTVQSNVSAHLARLERELGVTLYDRSGGFLTEEGRAAVRQAAKRVQAELDALGSDVAGLRDEVTGTVRLGCIGTSARWLVPLVLEAVTEAHPKVHVIVVDATTNSLLPRLLSDELDLAVVNLPVSHPDVTTEPLFDEDRLLIAPEGHPLASRERIAFSDLGDHDLLLEPRGTAFHDELDREAAAAGIELRAKAEVDGLRLIATLAFQGFGAAIVPATAAPDWLEGRWRRVPVDGLDRRFVGLARRSRGLPSGPARALRETVLHVVATEGAGTDGVHPAT